MAKNNPSVLNDSAKKEAAEIISQRSNSKKKLDADKISQRDVDIKSQLGSIYSDYGNYGKKAKNMKIIEDLKMDDIQEEVLT